MDIILGVFHYDCNKMVDFVDLANELNRINEKHQKPFYTTRVWQEWETGLLFTSRKINEEEAQLYFSQFLQNKSN